MLLSQNKLLASLPASVIKQWRPCLSLTEMSRGQKAEIDKRVYFPISCVFMMTIRAGQVPWTFLRFTGSNFVVGLVNSLRVGDIQFQGVVCGAGSAFVLPLRELLAALPAGFLGQTPHATAMARIAENGFQSAHCATHHLASQRLARVLLQASDCFGIDRDIGLAQAEISQLLAVRRETVVSLLSAWTGEGVIRKGRQKIHLLKREALIARSCECYQRARSLYDQEIAIWRKIQWSHS